MQALRPKLAARRDVAAGPTSEPRSTNPIGGGSVVKTVVEEIDATCKHSRCPATGMSHDGATYVLPGECVNCGRRYSVRITRGHHAPQQAECPYCGCRKVAASPLDGGDR